MLQTARLPVAEAPRQLELALPSDRAGAYTVVELQSMLAPLLVGTAVPVFITRWPLGGRALLILGASVGLWAVFLWGLLAIL